MKIEIKQGRKEFCIRIPTVMLFSGFGARFINFKLKAGGSTRIMKISPKGMKSIRRCIKEMRKLHKNWWLVEAFDSDGSVVKIRL